VATEQRHGALHVLVNNAAILHMAAIQDTTLADFERVVRVNQTGTFLGIRAVVPALTRAGGGSIVNISSVDGLGGKNGLVAYAASKWAVRGITKVAALELGRFGIRVNAVCPEAGSVEMIAPWVPAGVNLEKLMARSHRSSRSRRAARSAGGSATWPGWCSSWPRTRALPAPAAISRSRAATPPAGGARGAGVTRYDDALAVRGPRALLRAMDSATAATTRSG
jgi:NAD(P)-dependent dehydrogenase (short-subunit alcohol dehydrogenase family)